MEDRVMKKTLLILSALLALLSCNDKMSEKDFEIQPEEAVSNPVSFNVTVNTLGTKAEAKNDWADGDMIYVVFKGITTKFLTLTYDSGSWTNQASSAFDVSDFDGKDLKLTAVHFPMAVTPELNAGVLSFTSDGGPAYSYYLKQTGAEYTLDGSVVNVSLSLGIASGYAQFHIPGIQAGIADYIFQANGVQPVACSYINVSSGAITENEGTVGAPFKGFADAEGGVFSAKIVSPGTTQDYTFTLTGTNNVYTFSRNRSLAVNTFYRFPALSDSKWEKATGSSSVPEPEPGMLATPLTFEATVAGATVCFTKGNGVNPSLQYSTDGSNWNDYTSGDIITLNHIGDIVSFRATTTNGAFSSGVSGSSFTCDENCYIYGNIMSLLSKDDFATKTSVPNNAFKDLFFSNNHILNHPSKALVLPATSLGRYCYFSMFYRCESLTTAPELPATTLAEYCYNGMFYWCTSLTTAPSLPATTLANNCYSEMFACCTNLTTAPALPATTLADGCYSGMFSHCTSLNTAPALPATTLTSGCYSSMFSNCTNLTTAPALPAITLTPLCYLGMFENCTNLTTAPALPATTLAIDCYDSMFSGCTTLTTAPTLPAPTLVEDCYYQMFQGCSRLNRVTCLATDISANGCTNLWLDGVAASGKFTRAPSMTDWTLNTSSIPSGWFIDPPIGALIGKFSVSNTKQVYFSQGNLQATTTDGWLSSLNPWTFSFMDHQYSMVDEGETSASYEIYEDYDPLKAVGHFGWGTSGYNYGARFYEPYRTNSEDSNYGPNPGRDLSGNSDWGYNAISNGGNTENSGWRTLSVDEWRYLLYERDGYQDSLYGFATVCGVNGLVLLPDNWTLPLGCTFTPGRDGGWTTNEYDFSQWPLMESAGAVFLPAAGYRRNEHVSRLPSEGHYWLSSTGEPGDDPDYYAYCFLFTVYTKYDSDEEVGGTYTLKEGRSYGLSVRLVKDVPAL